MISLSSTMRSRKKNSGYVPSSRKESRLQFRFRLRANWLGGSDSGHKLFGSSSGSTSLQWMHHYAIQRGLYKYRELRIMPLSALPSSVDLYYLLFRTDENWDFVERTVPLRSDGLHFSVRSTGVQDMCECLRREAWHVRVVLIA